MHACVTEEQVDCVSKVLGKEWLFSITLSTYLPKFSHFVFVLRKYNYNAQLVFYWTFCLLLCIYFFLALRKLVNRFSYSFFPTFPSKKRRCERNLESCLRQTIIFPLLLFNCSLLLKFHIIFIHKNCFKLFLSARVLDFEKYLTWVCRLPFAINVTLNLSNIFKRKQNITYWLNYMQSVISQSLIS